jgi:hypothetical protein
VQVLHRPGDRIRHATAPTRRRRVRTRGAADGGPGRDEAWLASEFDLMADGSTPAAREVDEVDEVDDLEEVARADQTAPVAAAPPPPLDLSFLDELILPSEPAPEPQPQPAADRPAANGGPTSGHRDQPSPFSLLQAATLYTMGLPLDEGAGEAAATVDEEGSEDPTGPEHLGPEWAGQVWADEGEDEDEEVPLAHGAEAPPRDLDDDEAGDGNRTGEPSPAAGLSMLQAATLYTMGIDPEPADGSDEADLVSIEDDEALDGAAAAPAPKARARRTARRKARRRRRPRHINRAAWLARRTASRQGVLGIIFIAVVGLALNGVFAGGGGEEVVTAGGPMAGRTTTTADPTFSAAAETELDAVTVETLPTLPSVAPATTAVTALPAATATTAPRPTTSTTRAAAPTTAAPTTTPTTAAPTTVPTFTTTTVLPEPVTTTTRPPTTTSTSTTTTSTTTTSTTTTTTTTAPPGP